MKVLQIKYYLMMPLIPVFDAFAKLKEVTFSFVISVLPSVCLPLSLLREETTAPTGRIFLTFDN